MSFPEHAEYKDSGVERLGMVPAHWEVNQLRRGISFLTDFEANCSFSDMAKNTTFDEGEPFAWLVRATDLENQRFGICEANRFCDETTYDFLRKTSLHGGEFLVTKRGEIGKTYVVPQTDEPATLGPNLYLVRLNDKLDPEFAYYWFKGGFGNRQLEIRNQSTTIGALYKDDLRDCICLMPPPDEQKAIASFLDVESSKIDGLVSEQRRLIELLKEKRQAVISHAVTKGLNPNAPMKPSGIQWLGDVPQHWRLTKVRYEFDVLDGLRIPVSVEERAERRGDYPYYGASGIIDTIDDYLFDEPLVLVCEDGWNLLLRSQLVARPVDGKIWVNNHAHILRPRVGNTDVLASMIEQTPFSLFVTGTRQPKLTIDQLKRVPLAVPHDDKDFEAIRDFINEQEEMFSQLQAEAERAIELLQERRTALISAAVTGKIDVRGFASKETMV